MYAVNFVHSYIAVTRVVQVLEKVGEEYTRLQEYVRNTHAATHQQYDLEVKNVRLVDDRFY